VTLDLIPLSLIVALAFIVEAALGFGATVVTVSLGALLVPIDRLLPAFVPLNVILSGFLAFRDRHAIDWRFLFRRILPAMVLGLPVGMWAFRYLDARLLSGAFGAFVVVLAALELVGMWRATRADVATRRPLSPLASNVFLMGAGLVHGAFATGGPLVVYVLGRELTDKTRFRATLAVLWLVLNVILVASWIVGGQLQTETLLRSASLSLALVVGMIVGERMHRQVPAETFGLLVWSLLFVAGGMLVLRA
jgi:uncharacterized membrane protein YfcA